MAGPRKPFSMIREFHLADWFTLANAPEGDGWEKCAGRRMVAFCQESVAGGSPRSCAVISGRSLCPWGRTALSQFRALRPRTKVFTWKFT